MTDKSVVPEGMKAWAGGDSAPADWDGGPTLLRSGEIFPTMKDVPSEWEHDGEMESDIIAYTPKSNPLSLETSDLDPITPEEDAVATAILAAVGWTRQSHDTVVRAIRAGLLKSGAVIVPVEPTEAMLTACSDAVDRYLEYQADCADIWTAMLSAHSIQSGGEGGGRS